MWSRLLRRVKSQFDAVRPRGARAGTDPLEGVVADSTETTVLQKPSSPQEKFYKRALERNLNAFDSYALQSRSIVIRDVYAKVASEGCHDLVSLLAEIDYLIDQVDTEPSIIDEIEYKRDILRSLGSLLLDTARNELDSQAGLQVFKFLLIKYGDDALTRRHIMQFIEGLAELNKYAELAEYSKRFGLDALAPTQSQLIRIDRLAKESSDISVWLAALNRLYESLNMTPIELLEDTDLPLLDRLSAGVGTKVHGPKISVLVPTYSPGPGLRTAVRGLLQQTWTNVEIIIVDDGSSPDYETVLSEVENLDPAVRVVRMTENRGAYVARNAGLEVATGEFVTTHDDDDWSHPEKLATQAQVLVNDESVVATTSGHIRTTEDMRFRRVNLRPQHLQTNYSSLMFRKELTSKIGPWDTVNRGSDAELASRIALNYGRSSIVHLSEYPYSFSRVWSGSLTSGEMYRGYFAYSRLLYRWSYYAWHRSQLTERQKIVLIPGQRRPYPVPTTFEAGMRRAALGSFDVIYVTDFAQEAKFSETALHEIKSAIGAGFRVGYMHINSPQTLKRKSIEPKLFELQHEGLITQVSDADEAQASLMVVYDASIGMFLDEFRSSVSVDCGVVVYDDGISLKNVEERDPSYARELLTNLDLSFNTDFKMVGATHREQERLLTILPPDRMLSEQWLWHTHILSASADVQPPSKFPVVGFHTFGNKYRWPSDKGTFRDVYCSSEYESRFYGVTSVIARQYGRAVADEVETVDFKETSLEEFLESIDFWVYHPHELLQDRPWPPVLNAMQAGKVVILPPRLRGLYGQAAIYSEAEGVGSLVAEYSQDQKKYYSQALLGQNFVADGFDEHSFVSRLGRLIGD